MRIKITTDGLELTPRIRRLVNEKIGLGLEKHLPHLNEEIKTADVKIIKGSRWGYKVNFDMRLPKNYQIYAEGEHEGLLSALVNLRDKLIRQIKNYKNELKVNGKKIREIKKRVSRNWRKSYD